MIDADDPAPVRAGPSALPRVFVHDLMNQLCTILGHSELLLDALPPGAPAATDARAVRDACRKAIEVTERWGEPRQAASADDGHQRQGLEEHSDDTQP